MEFALDDEQKVLQERVRAFACNSLSQNLAERDAAGRFSHEDWQRCADFGIQSMAVPQRFSGRPEVDFMSAMLAMESLGYGCRENALTFALNAHMWTVALPIVRFGTEEQQQRYLPGMSDGSIIGAHAITEPDAGSDVFNLRTRASRKNGEYELTGTKRYITLAELANVILVFATVDPTRGRWGITAFLVDRNTPGLEIGPVIEKMGLRTVPMNEVRFDSCRIPQTSRLGPEGAGVSISTSCLEWERCCILASQLGAMHRQLVDTRDYARSREQFGRPISKQQAVSHRIVDMRLRLETSRLLLYKVAWLKQQGRQSMEEAALLKLHLSECFAASSLDAIRIHGARGYTSEAGVERDLRDAIGGTIYAGTSDIQRNIVASLMGL